MQAVRDSFSIVVLGSWNPSIFSPDWILDNLAANKDSQVDIAYPIEDPTAPRKITFEGVHLLPGRKKLVIAPAVKDEEALSKCVDVIKKTLTLLCHTPIGNVGVNFVFSDEDDSGKLADIFITHDVKSIMDKFSIKEANITRALQEEDKDYIVNFSIVDRGGEYKLSFNFHYASSDINYYQELFSDNIFKGHFDEAVNIVKNIYDISLEDNNDYEE